MRSVLDSEHPRYRDYKEMWQRYWDFYAGGEQLRRNAGLYLVRRQKEPADVYAERLSRVFYENYLGSCIDWYAASVFRSEPRIEVRTSDPAAKKFYGKFIEDCDRRGTSLIEAVKAVFIETLVFGEGYLLVDFPRVSAEAKTRAEEDALGKSRAFVARYSPREVTNWKTDPSGKLEWALLRTEHSFQESFESAELATEERWMYFDRERYRIYRARKGQGADSANGAVEVVDEGTHGLAGAGATPLVKMQVSEGLWLANKAALLAQEHFNKSNALSWALHMGLFAMPVIYSERDWQQIVGEAYYIQLSPEDKFGWTEPEGKVFQVAADNLDRLKDEIYRVCYLMTQAGGREARHLGQSGESKRRDFAITHEVLRAYGGTVKSFIRQVLRTAAKGRKENVEFEVTGLDEFESSDLSGELAIAAKIRELGIPSESLEQEVQKRVALRYLEGAVQETKNRVIEEIEAAGKLA